VVNADVERDAGNDLFPQASDCLPQPFVDETLYSWCARYHRLNGSNNPRTTSRRLFGHPTAGLRPEQPYHLGQFQKNTHRRLGSLDVLLRQRTVFGFYAPFLSPIAIAKVSQHLEGGDGMPARALLGMSKDGQSARAALRYCPECIKEQLASNAVSWWKREQLWPSLCICPEHGCFLTATRDKLLERASADYFLAHELGASQLQLPSAITPRQHQLLSSLTNWTTKLANMPDSSFDDSVLRFAYLKQAKQLGWVALDGSLRLRLLQESFLAQCGAIATFPAFHFIKFADAVNGGFLGTLLRLYPGRRHPSKHIVLMNFLFADFDELCEGYAVAPSTLTEPDPL
jgi:hypothetical protein